jgi:hypothetical protein
MVRRKPGYLTAHEPVQKGARNVSSSSLTTCSASSPIFARSRYLWNQIPGCYSLKDEDTVSDWVAVELQRKLSSPGIPDREITVSPRRGIGTATHQPGAASVFRRGQARH